jgi:glycosyltransferase involved in cell wall biosynthesis
VLYLGNAGWGHQFDTVVEAAAHMQAAGDRVAFCFVGGGSRWEYLAEEKRRGGLDNVVLRGYVPKEQTPSVMASAGCALITLRDEILGIISPSKLHSNLAMGLPVLYVGPAGGNVDEAVQRFGCGASLRHGDAAGLVAFVRRLAADPATRDALRVSARRAFEEAYCDRRTLPQFDAVLASLAPAGAAAVSAGPESVDSPAPRPTQSHAA